MSWQPRRKGREILARAWEHIQSVDYAVGARWLYYRLLDGGWYSQKSDYKNQCLPLLSDARKHFWNGWTPDTLADDTRESIIGDGVGSSDVGGWIEDLRSVECRLDKWAHQPVYIEILFEARAMAGQFRFYAPEITLSPFGGDASIPFKSSIARRLSSNADLYGVPVKLFYYGDLDDKGEQIFKAAMADIRLWTSVDFEAVRVGLTTEQASAFGLPENPERPGTWQWESLTDVQAASLIQPVRELIDRDAWERVEAEEREATARFRELLDGASW